MVNAVKVDAAKKVVASHVANLAASHAADHVAADK